MVRRFYTLLALALLALLALGFGLYTLHGARMRAKALKAAEGLLSGRVPAFRATSLRPVSGEASDLPMADLVGAGGGLLGTVTVRSPRDVEVLLSSGQFGYSPASPAEVSRLLSQPPLGADENMRRVVSNAVGGLRRLWPELAEGSVTLDRVEAVAPTADRATASFGLDYQGRHMGASVEVDMRQRRVVSLRLRLDES